MYVIYPKEVIFRSFASKFIPVYFLHSSPPIFINVYSLYNVKGFLIFPDMHMIYFDQKQSKFPVWSDWYTKLLIIYNRIAI
jgi:hypothetical protein